MIPYSTCMRFAQRRGSQRPWKAVQAQTRVFLQRSNDGIFCIRVEEGHEEETEEKRPSFLTHSEYCLIQAVNASSEGRTPSGPFLTLQKKHIHGPVTLPEAGQAILLDDAYYGMAKCLLDRVDDWAFNTFNLDVATGGRALSVLLVHFFHRYHFIEIFGLDAARVWSCFNLIEAGYHASNPYHNSVHAADVTQAMHCFLREGKIREHLTPVEAMSALLAAVCHDLDHPGVNQPFLIATSNHLATLYKNFSVLENHHWRSAIACLRESGIFDDLDRDLWEDIAYNIRSLILATDITRQQEFLSRFKRLLENNLLIMKERECRHFILQIGLKCADLCNPCRPWTISQRWSLQVCQEFYRQGDYERKLKLPVTPICDQRKTSVAKIQADFFKFVVTPLFGLWNDFLDTPTSSQLIVNLNENHARWDSLLQEQQQSMQSVSELVERAPLAEEEDGDLDDDYGSLLSLRLAGTLFDTSDERLAIFWARRHSMPLSQPRILPLTTIRRQSFPHAVGRSGPETARPRELGAFPLHRSPHLSLRTLSAEMLQPKTSILSLTGSGASLLGRLEVAAEAEKRLVRQLASYPPYSLKTGTAGDYEDQEETPRSPVRSRSLSDSEGPDVPISSSVKDAPAETQESRSGCSDGCCCPSVSAKSPCNGEQDSNQCAAVPSEIMDDLGDASRQSALAKRKSSCGRAVITRTTSYLTVTDTSVVLPLPPRYAHRSNSLALPLPADATATLQVSTVLARQTSDREVPDPWNASIVGPNGKTVDGETDRDAADSWCQHVGRGLSEERPALPSRDFDLPAPSWRGSCTSIASSGESRLTSRRGSAPVVLATDIVVECHSGGPKGGSAYVRRWSIPSEPLPGTSAEGAEVARSGYGRRPLGKELVRRHSFGLLEPFPAVPSSESENDGSSPAPTGTSCSSRRNSSVPQDGRGQQSFGTEDSSDPEGSLGSGSRDVFFPCLPAQSRLGRRRGSLPANFPPSISRRTVAGNVTVRTSATVAEGFLPPEDEVSQEPSKTWDRRRGSAGEILGVLLGTTATLVTLQALTSPSGPPPARVLPRRGSGGLELLSGFWRSRTAADVQTEHLGLQQASTGRVRLPRQALSLDSPSCSEWFLVGAESRRLSGISPVGNRLLCQRRRGSFPLDISLFSLSSGTTSCGD